jgi:uncharacterized protein YaaW (UPF0174 family)
MERIHKVQTTGEVHPGDRIPIVLKAISGFNSCLTVSAMSALFIWAVHLGVTKGTTDWPGPITCILMIIGPIIIALNFVNARSVITTIVESGKSSGDEDEEIDVSQNVIPVKIPTATKLITEKDVAIEREITGPTTVILRAIAGATSTHVICGCSLLFTWTIHDSMILGKSLPGNIQLFMVVVGPVITSWSFVSANATLSAVMSGASVIHKWRVKVSSVIAPDRK